MFNLRLDESLFTLQQSKPVKGLSFSTDEEMEESLLSSINGSEIIFWNLNE